MSELVAGLHISEKHARSRYITWGEGDEVLANVIYAGTLPLYAHLGSSAEA